MDKDLNAVSSEYMPNANTELENRIILNWYPQRIIDRVGRVQSILELGIGHGITAEKFSSVCDRYVVIEGASSVISQFLDVWPEFKGEIVFGYFEEFDTSEKFDVIVMGFILEHVDNPSLVLRKYRDFLKPNGRLFVAVPNAKSLNRRFGLELGIINDIYSLNENDLAQGHQRQYCRELLRDEVTNAAYRIVHEEGIYLKPLPLSFLRNLNDFDANLQAMLQVGIDFPDLTVAILFELTPN
jgi:SAM-dependent methyltransferase